MVVKSVISEMLPKTINIIPTKQYVRCLPFILSFITHSPFGGSGRGCQWVTSMGGWVDHPDACRYVKKQPHALHE